MGILANHRGAILAFSIGAPLVGFGLTLVYFGGDPYGSLRPLLVQFGLLAGVLFVGGAVTFAFYRRAEAKRKAEWALLAPVCEAVSSWVCLFIRISGGTFCGWWVIHSCMDGLAPYYLCQRIWHYLCWERYLPPDSGLNGCAAGMASRLGAV